MSEDIYMMPVETLCSFIKDTFQGVGASPEDAEACMKVIISSDLRGIESHGVGRLKYWYVRMKSGQHNVVTNFEIVRESPTTAVVDAHHGLGMVVGTRAMQLAIDKAKAYGMGSVAVRNSTHFGIAGYYPLMAVAQGMIGMTFTNARPSLNPTFGVYPMLGTNPIAFGAPSDEPFPFLFDGATPITQRGKIEVYARAEKPVPPGWIIDEQNQPMTDPHEILKRLDQGAAAFLPLGGAGEELGGHKGYGLATMVEIFSASLQQGSFLLNLTGFSADGKKQPYKIGHFFMAINVESFCALEDFRKTTGQILRELRASRKAPGHDRIYTAGEKEYESEKVVRARGVPINANLQKELKTIQQELGLTQYDFPF